MLDNSLNAFISAVMVFAGLGLLGGKAHAGDVDSCSLGGGSLAFGNYQPSNGNRTTVGSVQMSCTCRGLGTTTVSGSTFLTLSDSSSNATRVLQSSNSTVTYGVYSDANYSNVYPSVAGSAVFSFTGNCPLGLGNSRKPLSFSTPPTFTLYGRILDVGTNLNVSAGLYTGTLTLTISY
ncbi:spore coat protein U domain-containing protein [Limnobacter alexandrii]|uniref:spore coat protein U domain-containing protein n=1 Tax=Limnobacter alexandrii TaxID=2570352 RepID=UPI001109ECB9|nr:spore coat protein U domain-containing protein [Limnobacter alexandrii]